MALPDFIHRYLMTAVLKRTVVTYLLLGRDGTVAECGRGFSRFGLPAPLPGTPAGQLTFFDRDPPRRLEKPRVLPRVQLSEGRYADIHLVPAGDRIGVVLVDISETAGNEMLLQQTRDENRILMARLRREAESAEQARCRFLGTVSHEILTPVNGVLGTAALLDGTGLNVEQREYVDIIRTSADSLRQIITDILDLSKIESGCLELTCEPFDLPAAVEAAGDVLLHPIHEKGLAFASLVDPDVPPRLLGDADRLRQILLNLTANAVKFTSRGEIFVHVRLESAVQGRVVLRFEVRDTGIGIAPRDQRRLFQSFSQVDGSIRRRFGGTGLGLKISRQLTEAMNGTIEVESREGAGSTFRCRIPFALPAGDPPAPIPPFLKGRSVYYLGQDRPVARMLETWVSAWGGRMERVRQPIAEPDAPGSAIWIDGSLEPPESARRRLERFFPFAVTDGPFFVLLVPRARAGDAAARDAAGCDATLKLPLKHAALHDVLRSAADRAGPRRRHAAPAPRRPTAAGEHGLWILLADDNSVNRLIAKRILEQMGHRVDTVGNGREAIAALNRWGYDLVFMDIQMPEMDGIEATRRLRRSEAESGRTGIPVVAMTAHVLEEYKQRCLDAGMDDFIPKPIQPATLKAAISRRMPQISSRPSSAPATVPSGDHDAILHLLKETFDNDHEAMTDLLRVFIEGAWEYHRRLERAVAEDDREELRIAAHTLKGSAASFGSEHITALSELIENGAREGPLGELKPLLRDLEAQIVSLEKIRIPTN